MSYYKHQASQSTDHLGFLSRICSKFKLQDSVNAGILLEFLPQCMRNTEVTYQAEAILEMIFYNLRRKQLKSWGQKVRTSFQNKSAWDGLMYTSTCWHKPDNLSQIPRTPGLRKLSSDQHLFTDRRHIDKHIHAHRHTHKHTYIYTHTRNNKVKFRKRQSLRLIS